jgi:cAMP-dependent protein kinase regulator
MIKREPDLSESLLMEYYTQRISDITLARVALFSHLEPPERRKIGEHLTPVNVRKGSTIITEGEIGDAMYVIKSGQVGVYTTLVEEQGVSVIQTDQERLHLATLQAGDFFGEQALITREPRSATIIALTDVELLKFTKRDLAVVVKHYPRLGTLLEKYHQQRIADTLESLKLIW